MLLGLHFIDLCLHYQARGQAEPDRPLALIGGHPLKVLQCNSVAEAAGVAVGQRLATATALCTELIVLRGEPDSDEALQQLAQWAYGFSGQIHLVAPDTLLLEASSMLRLFGGLAGWLAQLKSDLNALALPWRAALAHTPLAATLLARTGEAYQITYDAPEPEAVIGALASLSLAQLERPEAPRLASMGVRTLAQLCALPRAELGRRFGAELLLWLERLVGDRPDPRPHYQPPMRYKRKLVLMEEISDQAVLRFPLKRLLSELGEMLRRRQLALPELVILLHHRHRPATRLALRGAGDEHRAEAWMALCQLKLERLTLYESVIEITLLGEQLQPLQAQSGRLIAGGTPDGAAQDLLARLSARLGSERVRAVQAVAEHQPEYASRPVSAGQGQDTREKTRVPGQKLQRPCWLLPQPQPIERQAYRLLRGPERVESGWWRGEPVARDYFIAQAPSGGVGWIFKSTEGWFLHGWF